MNDRNPYQPSMGADDRRPLTERALWCDLIVILLAWIAWGVLRSEWSERAGSAAWLCGASVGAAVYRTVSDCHRWARVGVLFLPALITYSAAYLLGVQFHFYGDLAGRSIVALLFWIACLIPVGLIIACSTLIHVAVLKWAR